MAEVDHDVREKVFERVQTCLGEVVSESGHLASYGIGRDSFEIIDTEDLDGGLTRYAFTGSGTRMSEFAIDPNDRETAVAGAIVLDEVLRLTFDDRGLVRFSPYMIVHPRFWNHHPEWAQTGEWESPDPDLYASEIPELIAGAYNPIRWRPGNREAVLAEVERMLEARGETVVLIDREAEIPDSADFETAMGAISDTLTINHDLTLVQEHLEVPRALFRRERDEVV